MTSAATQHANWTQAWRDQVLPELAAQTWDLIVIGGGITGAGVIREAAKRGWRFLLVEQRDFAWGTSSRSSKMVHGGLRYISQGELALTRDSVRERQLLLDNEAGLVEPLPFLYPHYQGEFPGRWVFSWVLRLYDGFAGQSLQQFHPPWQVPMVVNGLQQEHLQGASQFQDAVTDDARLTVRAEQLPLDEPLRELALSRPPLRIVIDGRLRVPTDMAFFTAGPVLVVTHQLPPANTAQIEYLQLPEVNGHVDLTALLNELGKRGINELMVEAGPHLAGAFIQAGLVDELYVYMAAKLLGSSAQPLLQLPIEVMADAVDLQITDIRAIGPDWRIIAKARL